MPNLEGSDVSATKVKFWPKKTVLVPVNPAITAGFQVTFELTVFSKFMVVAPK